VKTILSGHARWKLKKARVSQSGAGGTQQPGKVGMPKHGERQTRPAKRPRPEGSTPSERVRPPKMSRDSRGPGTFKKALTNIRVAIFKKNYPEDKLTEDEQDHIFEELGRVYHGTAKGELPHLRYFRLEGGTLTYVYAEQEFAQWLIKATDNHRLALWARLKAMDARKFPRPLKVALRTKDNTVKSSEELLK
jgi:hypothetical protein